VGEGSAGEGLGLTDFGADTAGTTGISFGAGSVASGSLACDDAAVGAFVTVSPESGTSLGCGVGSAGFAAETLAGVALPTGSAAGACAASPLAGWASGGAGFAVGSTGTTGAAAAAEPVKVVQA